MTTPVLATQEWADNAAVIASVAELHLAKDMLTLDPTWGKGNWWTRWRPDQLEASDVDPVLSPTGTSVDFRALPWPNSHFDLVAFDPPYVSTGGRETSGIKGMHKAYGMDTVPKTPAETQALVNAGLTECVRVAKPKGLILVKCQDYISSGSLQLGTYLTTKHAVEALGLTVVDRFDPVFGVRPQPGDRTRKCPTCRGGGEVSLLPASPPTLCGECKGVGRVASKQHHARRNISTLFVFRKPRA